MTRQAQEQLQRNYTEIAQLAGGLAHEVRNPLSTIRMNLDLLLEDAEVGDDPRTRRMVQKLERIRRECLHLEDILTAFLQFARAGELQSESVNLESLVSELVTAHQPSAQEQGIEFTLRLAADSPVIRGDATLLRQALRNLLLNAEQAMPGGGQIEIQTASQDAALQLTIIDSGCGIAPGIQERIFDAFFSTKPGGSGLGLPTVRKIVEAHGGSISCDSEPGKGTRFTLRLPLSPNEREPGELGAG